MSDIKIPYTKKPTGKDFSSVFKSHSSVFRPLLAVAVAYRGKKNVVYSLVDSGADCCLFPKGIADILGIDLKSGEEVNFKGIGDQNNSFYFHEVEIYFSQ